MMKRGLLLINLGTPNSAEIFEVRRFLGEFLIDKRVVDLPAPLRYLLVYGIILPFKPRQSAKAYEQIWTEEGSPLLQYSQNLVQGLQKQAGEQCQIRLGMRYGNPSIKNALDELSDCESITILPLYPQYSSAATGSALEECLKHLAKKDFFPSINIVHQFYQKPAYIKAQAKLIQAVLNPSDYLLFSYHGIPERQLKKASNCQTICIDACPMDLEAKHSCYRYQCFQTSLQLAKELNLSTAQFGSSFQSRLGKTPWIKPYTEDALTGLIEKGIKNLCICCPSFVTDCLETLEEIGIRAKHQWQTLGGQGFTLVPSLNADSTWVEAILEITQLSD